MSIECVRVTKVFAWMEKRSAMRSRTCLLWMVIVSGVVPALMAPRVKAQAGGGDGVIFAEDFEGGNFDQWRFTYSSDNGQTSGTLCPGTWGSEIVANSLEGSFSARLLARSTLSCSPWNVAAAIDATVSGGTSLSVKLKFDDIQGTGGAGISFFEIAVISADNTSQSVIYRFSTTGGVGGDLQPVVSAGDEIDFAADFADDFLSKFGTAISGDVILRFRSFADYAESGSGVRTADVRIDNIEIAVPGEPAEKCFVADLDDDCDVDFDDLRIMGALWLQGNSVADIAPTNPDNQVDYLDFSVLSSQWFLQGGMIDLQAGLNLVSIPFNTPDTYIPHLLRSIKGNYRAVFIHDPDDADSWQIFIPMRPGSLNGVDRIEAAQGFWIDMIQADKLLVNRVSDVPVDYTIHTGWNLISYPSQNIGIINQLLVDVIDSIETVYEYDVRNTGNEWTMFDPDDAVGSILQTMKPGLGYWVESAADELWRFDGSAYRKKRADLTVASVLTDPVLPSLLSGQTQTPVTVQYEFVNNGDVPASGVRWLLHHDHNNTRTTLHDFTMQTVAPGQVISRSAGPLSLAAGDHTFTVEVDPQNTVYESDETNNTYAHQMGVIPPVSVTLNQTPSSGEVPIEIDFSGSASGGFPPYTYTWLVDGKMINGPDSVSAIFSTAGTHGVDLLVADSTASADFPYQGSASNSFTLQANTATQQADLYTDIYNVALAYNMDNAVDIWTRVHNSQSVNVPAVRVTISVRDRNDPEVYDRVVFDDLVAVPANGSKVVVALADNLPAGDYTVRAHVNQFAAVPETDLTNNLDTRDFSITGLGYLPPVEIESVTFSPENPYPGRFVQIEALVNNNDIFTRFLRADYYYYDSNNSKQKFGQSSLQVIDPGQSAAYNKTWWVVPPQENIEVKVEIIDVLNDFKAARQSNILTLSSYDFGVDQTLVFNPASEMHDGIPLQITATINNLVDVIGDVKYVLRVDGQNLIVFPVRDILGNDSKTVTVSIGWSGGNNVRIRAPGQYVDRTLSKANVDTHSIIVEIVSIASGQPYEDLYESTISNNMTGQIVDILKGPECRFTDVVIGDTPRITESTEITYSMTNDGEVTGNFAISLTNDYYGRAQSQWVHDVIDSYSIEIAPGEVKTVTSTWTPTQPAWQLVNFDGDQTNYYEDVFVEPMVNITNVWYAYPGESEQSHDQDWVESENRLKLWTFSNAWVGDDTSERDGVVYWEFEIDDGTDMANDWIVNATVFGAAYGLINSTIVAAANTNYEARFWMGITEYGFGGNTNCLVLPGETAEPGCRTLIWHIKKEFGVVNFITTELSAVAGVLTYGVSDAVLGAIDALDCDQVVPFEAGMRFRRMKLRNRRKYKAFVRLDMWTAAVGAVVGTAHVYIDFYNRSPHECDFGGTEIMPVRGIWIDDLEIDARAVRWEGE